MIQQDYLTRLILQFVAAIARTRDLAKRQPAEAAEALEDAMSQALDLDLEVVLNLQPESFASIVDVSGTDPRLVEYVMRTLVLEAYYLDLAGNHGKARLRRGQAEELARTFGVDPVDVDDIPADGFEADFGAMMSEDGISER